MAINKKFVAKNGLVSPDAEFTGVTSIHLPSGNTAQRPAVAIPGMIRFNTDLDSVEGYDGFEWGEIGGGGGAVGGGNDEVFYENDQEVTTSYSITSGKNAMTTGPVQIANGAIITIPDGSRWVIL